MGNYCNGSALIKGDEEVLQRILFLCDNIGECSDASRFDADSDWLIHIFTKEVSQEGIFCDGCNLEDDILEIYIRASRTTAQDFFREMAEQLGLEITWGYVNDSDKRGHTYVYNPGGKKHLGQWELRDLDEEEEDEVLPAYSSGVQAMSLDSSSGPTTGDVKVNLDAITYRDVEVQLKLATATFTAARLDREQDYDMLNTLKGVALAHTLNAALMVQAMAEERMYAKHNTRWDMFVSAIEQAQKDFPNGIVEFEGFNPTRKQRPDCIVYRPASELYALTHTIYSSMFPRRVGMLPPSRLA